MLTIQVTYEQLQRIIVESPTVRDILDMGNPLQKFIDKFLVKYKLKSLKDTNVNKIQFVKDIREAALVDSHLKSHLVDVMGCMLLENGAIQLHCAIRVSGELMP